MLRVDKGNNLDLSDLFDAATFRAAAANLVYVALHFLIEINYLDPVVSGSVKSHQQLTHCCHRDGGRSRDASASRCVATWIS